MNSLQSEASPMRLSRSALLVPIALAYCVALAGCRQPAPSSATTDVPHAAVVEVRLRAGLTEESRDWLSSVSTQAGRMLVYESAFTFRLIDDDGLPIFEVPGTLATIDYGTDPLTVTSISVSSVPLTRDQLTDALARTLDALDEPTTEVGDRPTWSIREWIARGPDAGIPSPVLDWLTPDGHSSLNVGHSFDAANPGVLHWEWIPR